MINCITLDGCRSTPLGSYLKALGVFRILDEQVDPMVQACWVGDTMCLWTELDRAALLEFFARRYSPSILFNPWGGRSGFYPEEKAASEALDQIVASSDPRLANARKTVLSVRQLLLELGITAKPEDDTAKIALMRACRARLPDEALRWLDAVLVLTDEGRQFPPLLGTGGNEGSLGYTSGFAQAILAILGASSTLPQLKSCLFGDNAPGVTGRQTPGQYHPAALGGPNASTGFEGEVSTSPWDYVLTLEGTLSFAAAATKKLGQTTPGAMSFPFTVRAASVGYESSARADESESRGETWMPLWPNRATYAEVAALLAEGRVEVSRRQARNGLDFARAIASLGIDRGIGAFERFGYHQRHGLSIMTLPLGRWEVIEQPDISLLEDIDGWLERFRRVAMSDKVPAALGRVLRRIETTALTVCRRPRPSVWQDLIIALGQADAALARSRWATSEYGIGPVQALTLRWLERADDDSPEWRLAVSLASLQPVVWRHARVLPGLRGHILPLDHRVRWPAFDPELKSYDTVWRGSDLDDSLIAILCRRLQVCAKTGFDGAPVGHEQSASISDVQAYIAGTVDPRRIAGLAAGLCAIKEWRRSRQPRRQPDHSILPAAHALLRLVLYSRSTGDLLDRPRDLPVAAIRAANVGRIDEAVRHAARVLRAAGATPLVQRGFALSRGQARRTAAALLFGLDQFDTVRVGRNVIRNSDKRTKSTEAAS